MSLVLQDFADNQVVQSIGTTFAAQAIHYAEHDLGWHGLAMLAQWAGSDGAPLGYGQGPLVDVQISRTEVTLGWRGSWTRDRWIKFKLSRYEPTEWPAQVSWFSGTGRPSTFIMSVLMPEPAAA